MISDYTKKEAKILTDSLNIVQKKQIVNNRAELAFSHKKYIQDAGIKPFRKKPGKFVREADKQFSNKTIKLNELKS